ADQVAAGVGLGGLRVRDGENKAADGPRRGGAVLLGNAVGSRRGHGASSRNTAPSSTVASQRGTDSPGTVMQAPERRSNSQPCSGHVTMSPSTKPSQRLPPWWVHAFPMASTSSPRRKSATSTPSTVANPVAPGASSARSSTRTRGTSGGGGPSPAGAGPPRAGRGGRRGGRPRTGGPA